MLFDWPYRFTKRAPVLTCVPVPLHDKNRLYKWESPSSFFRKRPPSAACHTDQLLGTVGTAQVIAVGAAPSQLNRPRDPAFQFGSHDVLSDSFASAIRKCTALPIRALVRHPRLFRVPVRLSATAAVQRSLPLGIHPSFA